MRCGKLYANARGIGWHRIEKTRVADGELGRVVRL